MSTTCLTTCSPATVTTSSTDVRLLLPAVAAGDDLAMDAVWATYAGPIRGLARSLSNATHSDADEVVQEALAKVWTSAASFDPSRGTEATFIFTIARRVIIDRWRRAGRRVSEVALDDRVGGADRGATGEFDQVVLRAAMRTAIESLSAPQREVIELAYLDGFSQSEIADRIGVPLGTVKTRTFAALRALRGRLDHAGIWD